MKNVGPTFVMREEHREIGKHLEAIHQKVQAADPNSDEDERKLLTVLGSHNEKEENILYPAIDRLATDADIKSVFQLMKELPEERYAVCC